MSSPLLSEYSPRARNRIPNILHSAMQHSRYSVSRASPRRKTLKEEIFSFYARQSEGMPTIPAYLSNTVYAHLVQQQHNLYLKRTRHVQQSIKSHLKHAEPAIAPQRVQQHQHVKDERIGLPYSDSLPQAALYASTIARIEGHASSQSSSKKTLSNQEYAALEALINHDSFNHSLAIQDLRLPTAWDNKGKGEHVDIGFDRLQLSYRGTGKDENEISSARTDYPMRKQCGIYYFEIHIISKGLDGRIGIGFCRKINALDTFPGWEENSWGYHGENGIVYFGAGTGKRFGPKYSTGDVIGCGVDFRDMSAFYTKNGVYIGTAFTKIKSDDLYPFVGFKSPGEKVDANFGSKPFKFDIQQYLINEKRELLSKVTLKQIESKGSHSDVANNSDVSTLADSLIMEYLRHNGYTKAAGALEASLLVKTKALNLPKEGLNILDNDTTRRQEIRRLILDGDIDKVVDMCEKHYPTVLPKNPCIQFRLKCRKFMEMVRQSQANTDQEHVTAKEYEAQSLAVSQNQNCVGDTHVKRSNSKANLEVCTNKTKKQKINGEQDLEALRMVMTYGNKLKEEYGNLSATNKEMKEELLATFSTLAYSDLSNSAVAYLYETPHIESVASDLNSAILVSFGQYPNSSLERIYRQTSTAIESLVLGGDAKAALLEPGYDLF